MPLVALFSAATATTALVDSSTLHHFTFFVYLDFYQVITVRIDNHTMLYILMISVVRYQHVFTPRTNNSVSTG